MKIRNWSAIHAVFVCAAAILQLASSPHADVKLPALIGDNMVLQCNQPVKIWGWADPGEKIIVTYGEQQQLDTAAGLDGRWNVMLPPLPAGPVHDIRIVGKNEIQLTNLLAGEVWICSGQSNMERHLGPRPRQKNIVDWKQEIAAANYPAIRQFEVKKSIAMQPQEDVVGSWTVCSSDTAAGFTAVGYFFGRDLHQAIDLPVGLIHTSWGGTPAEAWTSAEALNTMTDFADAVKAVNPADLTTKTLDVKYAVLMTNWYQQNDPGSVDDAHWENPALNTDETPAQSAQTAPATTSTQSTASTTSTQTTWQPMTLPINWENARLPNYNGTAWFRKVIDLPASVAGKPATLRLGPVDDQDTTWINGELIGMTFNGTAPREYAIPENILHTGRNVIAVRVLDTGREGGLNGKPEQMLLEIAGEQPIALKGEWLFRPGIESNLAAKLPVRPAYNQNTPTVLYNAMLAPLLPYKIKGVIWYQGEANNDRAMQYRTLFPLMIADWRKRWELEDFPFLFVQIAPHRQMKPEIREAQFMTLDRSLNTAMAVTTDCGDARDIHPAHKQPVGARLALAARALAYGEKIEYSGPLFATLKIDGGIAVVSFTHTGGGLEAKDGALRGFEISGDGKNFVKADAIIAGNTIAVRSAEVATPVAVSYGWANVPDVNLYNKEGLPASPFRTNPD